MLSPEEQQLFRRLAVFVDGCTWEAAEAVCQVAGKIAGDVLDGLLSLVDKSLLREEESAEVAGREPRFWMLQMLREFGFECLASTGETEITRQAHATYFLALAEEAKPHLRGAEQARWLARLQQEHENMRTAFSWLLQSARLRAGTQQGGQQAEQALRLCIALEPFWYSRVYCREGLSFLEQALATRENVTTPVRARALYAAAEMAWMLDNTELTETLCAEGLALFRTLGDSAGMADALELFATSAWARGQYALARPQVEEAATLYQQMGDSWKQGRCLTQLARIATAQADYDQAHRLLEQSLAIYKALGDKERIGWVLYLQAQLLFLSQLDIARARNLTEQSLYDLFQFHPEGYRAYLVKGLQRKVKSNKVAV